TQTACPVLTCNALLPLRGVSPDADEEQEQRPAVLLEHGAGAHGAVVRERGCGHLLTGSPLGERQREMDNGSNEVQ
uniref:Uncharacterized protein n=1 Tax=Cynoglossus semilaevis TaxID=244447 RepID=A0A3P8WYE2_CYNSE